MKKKYGTIQDIYNKLDDIAGMFIVTNGKRDFEASYGMLKKEIRALNDQILKENPEFQR